MFYVGQVGRKDVRAIGKSVEKPTAPAFVQTAIMYLAPSRNILCELHESFFPQVSVCPGDGNNATHPAHPTECPPQDLKLERLQGNKSSIAPRPSMQKSNLVLSGSLV